MLFSLLTPKCQFLPQKKSNRAPETLRSSSDFFWEGKNRILWVNENNNMSLPVSLPLSFYFLTKSEENKKKDKADGQRTGFFQYFMGLFFLFLFPSKAVTRKRNIRKKRERENGKVLERQITSNLSSFGAWFVFVFRTFLSYFLFLFVLLFYFTIKLEG